MREEFSAWTRDLQDRITEALESLDGGSFGDDRWERPGGGGGRTRVLEGGAVLEKAGVNVSRVWGELEPEPAAGRGGEGTAFFAAGISLVLHPRSPWVPAVHANFRCIETGERRWFGGGSDLTPNYLVAEDAAHFHSVWKAACDRHPVADHARFKKWCDEYFFLPARGEARGIGGIFYDELPADRAALEFSRDAGEHFLEAWLPIAERRRKQPYGERERLWQLRRRGRYVEFNLLYDRGTVFGLRTGGRIESILMSLPPLVRWDYDASPPPGTPEAELLEVLRHPRDWLEKGGGSSGEPAPRGGPSGSAADR